MDLSSTRWPFCFDGDGKSDILWRETGGQTAIWFMSGATVASAPLYTNVSPNWTIVGLRKGDLIIAVGSDDVTSVGELQDRAKAAGVPLVLRVIRGDAVIVLEIGRAHV